MATFSIESNGHLEKTAVYLNGQQLGGIQEVMLNVDEEGVFDAVIQYEGTDKQVYTKQIFWEQLTNIRLTEPSFTEDEAKELRLLTIESDGRVENTAVFINEEQQNGIVNLFVHIKAVKNKQDFRSLFKSNKQIENSVFRADITYRNEDESIETEEIF